MMLNAPCFRQPSPNRNPGGDCFACALKNVVDYFYPENPIPFDQVWESWQDDGKCSFVDCQKVSKPHLHNTWTGLYRALQNLYDLGYEFDWNQDVVHPEINERQWAHNWGWTVPEMKWNYRVMGWLAQGYLLMTDCSLAGVGPFTADGKSNWNDHFIVIDGQREFWLARYDENGKRTGGTGKHETHVVCSAKGPYWIDTGDLHYWHGVNAFYAIRRRDIKPRVYRNYSWDMSPENQALIKD